MTTKHPILNLIDAGFQTLADYRSSDNKVGEQLELLHQTALPESSIPAKRGVPAIHEAELDIAMQCVDRSRFGSLCDAISAARDYLWWSPFVDEYYTPESDLGAHFVANNMFCDIIGPLSAAYVRTDVRMGLFLMPRRTHYRDHIHAGEEVYVLMTGDSGWRFDRNKWEDKPSDVAVWNPSWREHAMRTYDTPLLCLYAWHGDITRVCETVPMPDWQSMEAELQSGALTSSAAG